MFFSKKIETEQNNNNGNDQNWKVLFSDGILKNTKSGKKYPLDTLGFCTLDNEICFWHKSKHLITLKANESIVGKLEQLQLQKAKVFIPQYPKLEIVDTDGKQWNRFESFLTNGLLEVSLATLRIESVGSKYTICKYGKPVFTCENINTNEFQKAIDIAIAKAHTRLLPKPKPKKVIIKRKSDIMVTTETFLHDKSYIRLNIITAECSYGMNVFKDIFASIRDVVGGRSKAVQNIVRDSKDVVIDELKQQAVEAGADAIIGVDLDYTEFGDMGMFLVIGSGTLVKFK